MCGWLFVCVRCVFVRCGCGLVSVRRVSGECVGEWCVSLCAVVVISSYVVVAHVGTCGGCVGRSNGCVDVWAGTSLCG